MVTKKQSLTADTIVRWGHQGHDEQRAAAIIGAQLGYASLKNALGLAP